MNSFSRILLLTVILTVASCSGGKMSFKIDNSGLISMSASGTTQISPSPLGLACVGGTLYAPQSAKVSGDKVSLEYECGTVVLSRSFRSNGSIRLEVVEIDDEIDTYFFGPYECPQTVDVGDMVGAAWHEDGSLVCIQSLNPKTVGQFIGRDYMPSVNETGFPDPGLKVAYVSEGKGVLSCHADNYTRQRTVPSIPSGLKNVVAEAISAPEGSIVGAAVILTYASCAEDMLRDISDIELEEGLPHPLLDGEWAKTNPHAADIYFDFNTSDIDSQIRIVERAGSEWIYFSDPFKSWGQFDVSTEKYPGGDAQFKAAADNAMSHGVNVGTHTLSNFIHTYDDYVTPVPNKDLLAFDPTPITKSIGSTDTRIFIGEALNYAVKQTLSLVRLEDELIYFESFDPERLCLEGCRRGACGTAASDHPAGTVMTHMADHGYETLFPNHALQSDMAGNIGDFMSKFGLRRLSFDGLEGCTYTGHGEFGTNSFVQTVFDHTDGNIICDASTSSHYRWHALSYFNWGEPWYDSDRRGGNYNYRARNQDYFHRNLLPGMLGWYKVCNSDRVFEPTLPETLEFIMSRTVAYQAGLLLSYSIGESEKSDNYLDMVRMWQEFRFTANVPEEIRDLMKVQKTDWHLEKDGDKWLLSEIAVSEYDLRFTDRKKTLVQMESGTSSYKSWGNGGSSHMSNVMIDRSATDKSMTPIVEPAHLRVRVGTPEEKGQLHEFALCGGWYGSDILVFDVTAEAGDYLEYRGGKTLYRYDRDYNLLETVEGTGEELIIDGANLNGLTLRYNLSNEDLTMTMKYLRKVRTFEL